MTLNELALQVVCLCSPSPLLGEHSPACALAVGTCCPVLSLLGLLPCASLQTPVSGELWPPTLAPATAQRQRGDD